MENQDWISAGDYSIRPTSRWRHGFLRGLDFYRREGRGWAGMTLPRTRAYLDRLWRALRCKWSSSHRRAKDDALPVSCRVSIAQGSAPTLRGRVADGNCGAACHLLRACCWSGASTPRSAGVPQAPRIARRIPFSTACTFRRAQRPTNSLFFFPCRNSFQLSPCVSCQNLCLRHREWPPPHSSWRLWSVTGPVNSTISPRPLAAIFGRALARGSRRDRINRRLISSVRLRPERAARGLRTFFDVFGRATPRSLLGQGFPSSGALSCGDGLAARATPIPSAKLLCSCLLTAPVVLRPARPRHQHAASTSAPTTKANVAAPRLIIGSISRLSPRLAATDRQRQLRRVRVQYPSPALTSIA